DAARHHRYPHGRHGRQRVVSIERHRLLQRDGRPERGRGHPVPDRRRCPSGVLGALRPIGRTARPRLLRNRRRGQRRGVAIGHDPHQHGRPPHDGLDLRDFRQWRLVRLERHGHAQCLGRDGGREAGPVSARRRWMEAYSDPIMLREGRHILEYYSTDWAGNPEPEHTKAIDIDTTDPMASASVPSPSGHDGWYLSALSVQLEASDATSGVTGLFYQVDGGGWQHYTLPFMIGTGQHLVRFYSTDLAGRSSPVGSLSLNVDPTAPTTRGTLAAT